MRSVVACAAALAAAPLAACSALTDEVALLQMKAHEQPAEEDRFELLCDDLTGCHYHLHTSSTPAPYQLICDGKEGCRYTGVTQPPARNPPALLRVEDQDQLELMLNKLSAVWTTPPPRANPLKGLNLHKMVAKLQQMDLSQVTLPEVKLPKMGPLPAVTLPEIKVDPAQLNQWANEYRGAEQSTAHVLKPNFTAAKWLIGMTQPEKPAPPLMDGTEVAHFIPDNKMCCVEGPSDYIREKVEKIKSSPLGAGYQTTAALNGPCTSKGYDQGPSPEMCFPKAKVWMSRLHPIDPTSEPRLFADYAATHGWMAIPAGVMELCKP